uniref:Uncharacterized protein n=1 Tax=Bos mutus grunniens TaxID=30521 RepID=A0A8B9XHP5_BOSMU
MAVAYGLISRELYLGLRFDGDSDSESQSRVGSQGGLPGPAQANGRCRSETRLAGEDGDGCYVQLPRSRPALEMSALTAPTPGPGSGTRPAQAKLLAKKRVVRMLLVIVVANTWRARRPRRTSCTSGAPISFIHLLSYACLCQPLVYCFMHRRFARPALTPAPAAVLGLQGLAPDLCRTRTLPPSIASLSRLSYTTISTLGPG